MGRSADVVVCGAGIAGVAVAHHLTAILGVPDVVLCDPRPPLTLTSDKSTECYRNLWPNASMVALMNRSIDLMEEFARASGNAFGLNRRGYLYATADPDRLEAMRAEAEAGATLGVGPLRVHGGAAADPPYLASPPSGWEGVPAGTDLITSPGLLHDLFPWLGPSAVGALHVRRAGWLSAQQLGAWLLDEGRRHGLTLQQRALTGVRLGSGRVTGVDLDDGSHLPCGALVIAAGPMLGEVAGLLGETLPVQSEVHLKVSFADVAGAMPRQAPMVIWSDPQALGWSQEERVLLESERRVDLLGELPRFCHGRPEGGPDSNWALALWEYHKRVQEPSWPLPDDPLFAEVVLRGMEAMLPAMASYRDRLPRSVVDGGYYTKTPENRPLAGPMETPGAFVAGALSGFGIMAACGLAEIAALHVTGGTLPDHAAGFSPQRYLDAGYLVEVAALEATGQL
ncbi:MAG: FAD-dependent oxidoreductase [Acidimicrobiia bacterium]|nr:MAG: FAD-dependent oxidoreductase [Acidimicrobiia bacterium]